MREFQPFGFGDTLQRGYTGKPLAQLLLKERQAAADLAAEVHYAILAPNVVVEGDAVVGERPESIDDMGRWGIAVVGENRTVGKGAVVKAKAMCYDDVKEGEIKC